jgi:putative ABC transport system ATP-binding protein
MQSPSAVHFENVTKSYHLPDWTDLVLYEDLHFTIPSWTFASLMGASGSWKSTLLNLMAWLVTPNTGNIQILWHEITSLTDEQKTRLRGENIGFIFQSFNLLPYLTVEQNIDLVLDLNNLERRFWTEEIASLVGLWKKLNHYPAQLSGGEQQRVGIARALVWNTTLILADEPTGNLDKKTSQQIMDLLLDLHKRIWCTIVLITHDPLIAAQTQLQLKLEEGKIVG